MSKKTNAIGFCEDYALLVAFVPAVLKGLCDSANGGDFNKSCNEVLEKSTKAGRELDKKHGDLIEKQVIRTTTKVTIGSIIEGFFDLFS